MSQQAIYIALFLVVIACLPLLTKWLVGRNAMGKGASGAGAKVVSVVAVGPSQRVVTLEAGPEHDRLCLVIGVTAQNIICLHRSYVSAAPSNSPKQPPAAHSRDHQVLHDPSH